jgi:glycosyltransferase involved in cell wall biosynthesis
VSAANDRLPGGGDEPLEWIVFGEDWGRHPSTTQHVAPLLARTGPMVWFDSIGTRSPKLGLGDLSRIAGKLRTVAGASQAGGGHPTPEGIRRARPLVLPWHRSSAAVAWNRRSIGRAARAAGSSGRGQPRVVVAAYPTPALYAGAFPDATLVYLRLDDFPRLPGVDAELLARCDAWLMQNADLVAATSRNLLPADPARGLYLPQGVDTAHFGKAPLEPPAERTLGFFGLLAPWVDVDLMAAVAAAAPDWTLEVVGRSDVDTTRLRSLPNVRLLPPVPYGELPAVLSRWRATWIPFRIDDLTKAVNPLKLREGLAAGLPTFSTPMPEARLAEVTTGTTAEEVLAWLRGPVLADDAASRARRRASVASDGWDARATLLADAVRSIALPKARAA